MNKPTTKEGEIAFGLHQQLLELKRSATAHFYRLGEVMKTIRDNEYWKTMGYDSFLAYFSDPELSFEEGSVYRAIKLVEAFPQFSEVEHIPVGKLLVILPHLTPENRETLLEQAASLPRGDLAYQLGPGKEGKLEPLPKIYRCRDCQQIKGVQHLELCVCGWTPRQRESLRSLVREVIA